MATANGPIIAGSFRVTRLVARGRASLVYRARDLNDDTQVVVKVITREPPSWQRIERLTSLRHPAIVPVWMVDTSQDDRVSVIMPDVEQPSLTDHLVWGPVEQQTVRIGFRALAQGLATAHARGLTHGQITTDRIVVNGADEPVPFALRGWDHALYTADSAPVGLDIEALGMAMAAALTGRLQPSDRPVDEVAPGWLMDIARGCTQGRYATASDVVDALSRTRRAVPPWLRWGIVAAAALIGFLVVGTTGVIAAVALTATGAPATVAQAPVDTPPEAAPVEVEPQATAPVAVEPQATAPARPSPTASPAEPEVADVPVVRQPLPSQPPRRARRVATASDVRMEPPAVLPPPPPREASVASAVGTSPAPTAGPVPPKLPPDMIGATSWSGTVGGRPSWWSLDIAPDGQVTGTVRTRIGADSQQLTVAGRAQATGDGVRVDLTESDERRPQRYVGTLRAAGGAGTVLVRGRERAAWSVRRP